MGLSFRRSRALGGNSRLTFGSGGLGISFGRRGLRVGLGPRGLRAAATNSGFTWRVHGVLGFVVALLFLAMC